MPAKPERYVEPDSYFQEYLLYQNALERWRISELVFFIVGLLGATTLTLAARISRRVEIPTEVVYPIGYAVLALGVLGIVGSEYMLRKIRNLKFSHRLALHFMSDMGIKEPRKVIADNPRYLAAFEEVQAAVTTREREGAKEYRLASELSYRIASLVLRDEKALSLTPRLISLITSEAQLDYDDLMQKMDA